jgi:hypothetical protein
MWANTKFMWIKIVRVMIFQIIVSQKTIFDHFGSFWELQRDHMAKIIDFSLFKFIYYTARSRPILAKSWPMFVEISTFQKRCLN